ncbi:MAG: hypothetical protein AB7Q42_14730 [Acidimicrobiia bacterium]
MRRAMSVLAVIGVLQGFGHHRATAAVEPVFDPAAVEAWAWCGVHPDDSIAVASATSMATVADIDATFGPCMKPPPGYSPAFPGGRYVDPDTYMRLVQLNAQVGMKTVVYDARVWDDDPAVRNEALTFWAPVFANIQAWDMGDEFDPASTQWAILVERWAIVLADATVRSGIRPYTNTLPFAAAMDHALNDLPGSHQLLSFAKYNDDKGDALARQFRPRVETLMCGVNAFTHHGYTPSAESIEADMRALQEAGCGQFLVFGGHHVYNTNEFGATSLTDLAGAPTDWAPATFDGALKPDSGFTSVSPARLLETRVGEGLATGDGLFNGIGERPAGSTTELQITGRANVPDDADAVVLNVTVVDARAPGYVTVFPCGSSQPIAANLNYVTRSTVPNAVIAKIGAGGKVCFFTQAAVDLVVDMSGYFPAVSRFDAVQPERLLETRSGPGLSTFDGQFNGIGALPATSVTELQITGRAGVPADADAVALNVTVADARAPGYVTVFPCGSTRPNAANINYVTRATVPNAVISKIGDGGKVCIYTQATVDLIVDINGFHRDGVKFIAHDPARLLETRVGPGLTTADGQTNGIGPLVAGSITELQVAGRVGVPADASTAALNVTVADARGPGFISVFPCGSPQPNSANLNYRTGSTVANAVITKLGDGGKVCLFALADTDLVVDIGGYYVGD